MTVIPELKGKEDPPVDYCKNCSMHGVKYVKQAKTLIERIIWAVIILISLAGCITLTWNIYQKRILNPVIISFDETPVPIWEVI